MTMIHYILVLFLSFQLLGGSAQAQVETPAAARRVVNANPENYRDLLKELKAGDTLSLEPGIYEKGLPVYNLQGTSSQPILITTAEENSRVIFNAQKGSNTVSIVDSSYIIIRNLELDGKNLPVDGVKAEGHAQYAHHIMLENLYIHGYGANQQIVGISTKCPAWDWVVRGNVIVEAGTGMYFGNSDGTDPFIRGLIEYNVIVNTLGYNMQIKHQLPRPALEGMPVENATTVIRHNVFSKVKNASTEMPRPNVLVGHWPLKGPGQDDIYQIYGNFFYQNPTERLFQGEGHITMYNNIFYNMLGDAVAIQKHHDFPRRIYVFYNTVVAANAGIIIREPSPDYDQMVLANVVFAVQPLAGAIRSANKIGSLDRVSAFLNKPIAPLGELDLYPRSDRVTGSPHFSAVFKPFLDWNLDFNGIPREAKYRGAYSGSGDNPGWTLQLDKKSLTPS